MKIKGNLKMFQEGVSKKEITLELIKKLEEDDLKNSPIKKRTIDGKINVLNKFIR